MHCTAVYCEVILGKSNDEYCAWIQKDQSWGGAIELGILSEHYGVEICAIDVTHVNVYRFGESCAAHGNLYVCMYVYGGYFLSYLQS
jgi:ubiquitin thioesterase OTU1